MRRQYFRGARQSLVVAGLVLCGCSSGYGTPNTTTRAPSTTVNVTNPTTDLLMSACFTDMTRAQVRTALVAMGKTPAQVEGDLEIFDGLVATGDC